MTFDPDVTATARNTLLHFVCEETKLLELFVWIENVHCHFALAKKFVSLLVKQKNGLFKMVSKASS